MAENAIFGACVAAGFRVNEADGTVDGVSHGIAWRLIPKAGTLDMSVNISEKNLQKWQADLTGGTVAFRGFGVQLTVPGMAAWQPDDLLQFIDNWTGYAECAAATSHEDKFESYKEPASRYWLGLAGALLGALCGTIPWVLISLFGYQLGLLGALISIGAFYGYSRLGGAHDTRFAVTVIIICSLVAVMLGQIACTAIRITIQSEQAVPLWVALSFCFTPAGLVSVAGNSFFALLMCALGFVGIRGKVMEYTHESGYLRRRK